MKIQEIISILEQWAPRAYAEDFDNVGLLLGKAEAECTGILITHDVLENVVDEAITKKYNFIVCFHPIIFSGLKKLTGKTYVERVVAKAIKNDIAIYAIHTALDNLKEGVSHTLAVALELEAISKCWFLSKIRLKQLTTYVPKENCKCTVGSSFIRRVRVLWVIMTNVALSRREKDHSEEMKIPNPTWASQ